VAASENARRFFHFSIDPMPPRKFFGSARVGRTKESEDPGRFRTSPATLALFTTVQVPGQTVATSRASNSNSGRHCKSRTAPVGVIKMFWAWPFARPTTEGPKNVPPAIRNLNY